MWFILAHSVSYQPIILCMAKIEFFLSHLGEANNHMTLSGHNGLFLFKSSFLVLWNSISDKCKSNSVLWNWISCYWKSISVLCNSISDEWYSFSYKYIFWGLQSFAAVPLFLFFDSGVEAFSYAGDTFVLTMSKIKLHLSQVSLHS